MPEEIPLKKKRVLIIRSSYLLSSGVECLLKEHPELEVTAIENETSTDLVEDVMNKRPEVLILDESTVVANLSRLVELFDKFPEIRVIVVNLENNHMSVFDKRYISIQHLTDFYAAL